MKDDHEKMTMDEPEGPQRDDLSRWNSDFLKEWQGRRRLSNITEMLYNSPTIGGLRLSLEMPIRSIQWSFVGPEGIDEENDPGLALLNDSLDNMTGSWNDHIVDAILAVFYGFQLFSITYERNAGRFPCKKLGALKQETIQDSLYA